MTWLFSTCAVIGGTIIVFQFAMMLLGMADIDLADDVDVPDSDSAPHDGISHASDWLFSVISFRTVIAALAFFGLTGLAGQASGLEGAPLLGLAIAAGLLAMYGVYWLMKMLAKLRSEGNVQIERAVGVRGSVYVRIPGNYQGNGKIHLNLQNRTVELLAQTAHDTLPTGATIVVTRVLNSELVEVEPALTTTEGTHA